MLAPWFLIASVACQADAVVAPVRPVRADVLLRFVVRSDPAVRRVTLTTVLPEDAGEWQDVVSLEFDPKPTEVFERGGQHYARFTLVRPPVESFVEIRAGIDVGRADFDAIRYRRHSPPPTLSPAAREAALAAERYLESDDAAVRAVARRIAGQSSLDRARSALDLTLEHLAPSPYDPASVGAKGALELRRGDCTEYADLLTALLRADGIPARRAYGLLLESAATPKHDWVEVHLDDLGWVLLDPLHVERGASSFERSPANYVRLSTLRNDDALAGYHYFSWQTDGGVATVSEEFRIEIEPPADPSPEPASVPVPSAAPTADATDRGN